MIELATCSTNHKLLAILVPSASSQTIFARLTKLALQGAGLSKSKHFDKNLNLNITIPHNLHAYPTGRLRRSPLDPKQSNNDRLGSIP